MSSNKRRKVESQDAPQSAVSAMSALSARRRLAGAGGPESPADSPATPEPNVSKSSNSNAFSVLQNLSRHGDSPSMSTPNAFKDNKVSTRTPRSAAFKRSGSDGKGNESGTSSSQTVQFSSFRPTKRNCRTRTDGATELRLEDSERFLVLGSFGVQILEGEMTLAGATLRPDGKVHWVHAPHCHAIPVLRTREHTRLELHTDKRGISLRQLGRLSPLFRRMWNEPQGQSKGVVSSFQILCSSDDAPKKCIIQDLVSPPEWNKKLSSLVSMGANNKAFTTLVCGPKSAGKSTFSRILTNRLITRRVSNTNTASSVAAGVAVLDLDPGQPEYAVPGTVSLVHVTQPNLSPPFTHASMENPACRVLRCHALASVTPASDPDYYREAVVDLLNEYRSSLRQLPLVVNTPGWILGTGLELLGDIITCASPDDVVYMSEDGPAEAVEALQAAAPNTFSTLPSQPAEFTARTGAHLRGMQTMSYFHSEMHLGADSEAPQEWNPAPLTTVAPCQVQYAGPRSGISGVLSYDHQPPLDLLADTINGMVLAAVEIEDPRAYRGLVDQGKTTPTVSRTPEGIPMIRNPDDLTLDPRHCRTVGLVLVRGIDITKQRLQLITPIHVERLQNIQKGGRDIVLIHGKFDAPSWAYTEDLYYRGGDDDGCKALQVEDQDTSEDDSDMEPENMAEASDMTTVPWVEILKGHDKRPVGSKVWRVRRDLGRNGGE